MPLLEFGTAGGLAVKNDFAAHDAQQMEIMKMERQMRLDSEARAKLEADEHKLPDQMDEYNNPRAQKLAEDGFKAASVFELANNDWRINPVKRAQRDKMLHDAVNNKYTYNGMRFKEAEKQYRDYIAAHPGAIYDKEIQDQANEIKAYKAWNDPNSDPPEYIFRNPENRDKMMATLQEAASKASLNGIEKNAIGGERQFVTDASKDATAAMYAQTPEGDKWKRQFDRMPAAEKVDANGKPITFAAYIRDQMNPAFKVDFVSANKYTNPVYDANGNLVSGNDAGQNDFQIKLDQAMANPFEDIPVNSTAMSKMKRDDDGNFNLSDSFVIHSETGNIKDSKKIGINLGALSGKQVTSGGVMRWFPDLSNPAGGMFMTKYIVKVPENLANREAGKIKERTFGNDVLDTGQLWGSSDEIRDAYQGYGIEATQDKDNPVQMEIWTIVDPAQARAYNHAIPGAKTEAVSSGGQQQQQQQPYVGQKFNNGSVTITWDGSNYVTDDGKIYQ